MRKLRNSQFVVVLVVFLLVLYVGSYLILSRNGFRRADEREWIGFYFVEPDDERSDVVHLYLTRFYYPLILIDNLLGTGRRPACAPLRRFSGHYHRGRGGVWTEHSRMPPPAPDASHNAHRHS